MGNKKEVKQRKVVEVKSTPDLKKESNDVDKFVRETLTEIRERSNLSDFDVNYRFTTKRKIRGNREVAAEIIVDPHYLNAHITLRPQIVELYKAGNLSKIKKTLCHEMAHIRTERLAGVAMDRFTTLSELRQELETLTEVMGRLMYETVFTKPEIKEAPKK